MRDRRAVLKCEQSEHAPPSRTMTIRRAAVYGCRRGAAASRVSRAANMPVARSRQLARSARRDARPARPRTRIARRSKSASQAARLHARLAAAPVPDPNPRNPFAFGPRAARRASASRGHATRRHGRAGCGSAGRRRAPLPVLTLMGIAEETTAAGPRRTAVIGGDGDAIYMVTEGQTGRIALPRDQDRRRRGRARSDLHRRRATRRRSPLRLESSRPDHRWNSIRTRSNFDRQRAARPALRRADVLDRAVQAVGFIDADHARPRRHLSRPSAKLPMLTPWRPSAVPTSPITPGRSSLAITTSVPASGASIGDAVEIVQSRGLDGSKTVPSTQRSPCRAAQLHRNHVREVARPACCATRRPRAPLAGERAGVDGRHVRLRSARARRPARRCRSRFRRRSSAVRSSGCRSTSGRSRHQLRDQRAELLREQQIRPQLRHVVGRNRREVDGVPDDRPRAG